MTRAKIMRLVAMFGVLAIIVGVAVTAQGFEVQKLALNSNNIWILQAGVDSRYGQVNTSLKELTSANRIAKTPSQLIQSEAGAQLYATNPYFVNIDSTKPVDYTSDDAEYLKAPGATQQQLGSSFSAYLSGGRLWLAEMIAGVASGATEVPSPEALPEPAFAAIAITEQQGILAFSTADEQVYEYDVASAAWLAPLGAATGSGTLTADAFQLAAVGEKWALLHTTGKLWVSGSADAVDVVADSQLQGSSPAIETVYLADPTGFSEVAFADRAVTHLETASGAGVARPTWFDDAIFAAWADKGSAPGALAKLVDGQEAQISALDFNEKSLEKDPVLVIQTNGKAAVVNDTISGWAWALPTGELIKSTQNWDLLNEEQVTGDTAKPVEVTKPADPIAENDAFGVRAGELVTLPVLLNDHDPNRDSVLTIEADSLTGLSDSFGSVRVSNDGGSLVIAVAKNASGSASLRYKISDGTEADGRLSKAATVRLTVKSGANTAPVWCEDYDPNCLQAWPSGMQVQPGESISVPALSGWVDPEGDRLFISAVDIAEDQGNAGFNAAGYVVYQNNNPSATTESKVNLTVHISDVRGKESKRILTISVTPNPKFKVKNFAVNTTVGQPITVDISSQVQGAVGGLTSIVLPTGEVSPNATAEVISPTKFTVTSTKKEQIILAISATDAAGNTATSNVRVNVLADEDAAIASAPVTILVSPMIDSSINLFDAVHNPSGRALAISELEVVPEPGNTLYADKIKGGFIRVRGKTELSSAGFIGVVNYKLSDGTGDSKFEAVGQAFIYEVAETKSLAPVAISDFVTVRAGKNADVDVLANDVGSPGIPLSIDASSLDSECLDGGLIFSNGSKVRLVAPTKPGDYRCAYAVYAAGKPTLEAVGTIIVHVVEAGANAAPLPENLIGRVQAGESVEVPVNLQGIDPDGDVVSLIAVGNSKNNRGYASLNTELNGVVYSAVPNASGQDEFTYTVRDASGLESEATVRIVILNTDAATAPVTMIDFTDLVQGEANQAIVDPTANDFDPRGQKLTLVKGSLKPDVAATSPLYKQMQAQVKVEGNRATFTATKEPMTLNYVYSVKNERGSISNGSIVVRVAAEAAVYYPEITDTYLTIEQLNQLASGVDVVSQKVAWASGDVGGLKLSIWGNSNGFTASGKKISLIGAPPTNGAVVVFELRGKNNNGEEVANYGLLHVPSLSSIPLTLDPNAARQTVKENESVTFDISKFVVLPNGSAGLQIDRANVAALGARDGSTCVANGSSITYQAGSGEPWQDGCVVPARVGATGKFTPLMVPITVIPAEPEPELTGRQLTVIPGNSNVVTLDLKEMTFWLEHDDLSSLTYEVTPGSSTSFAITQDGSSIITIKADANATTGVSENFTVKITNHEKTLPAILKLTVGESNAEKPRGGSITKECRVTDAGNQCTMDVTTIVGGYNPYPEQLKFAPFGYVSGTANYGAASNSFDCGTVKIRAEAGQLVATWKAKAAGANCVGVAYRVIDAEGMAATGVLDFTMLGAPNNVQQAVQTDYSAHSITLGITAGRAANSSPAIAGFVVRDSKGREYERCDYTGASVTNCVIEGLDTYDGTNKDAQFDFEIFAFNEIDAESENPARVTDAYAYQAPKPLTKDIFVKVTSVYGGETKTTTGVVDMIISPIEDKLVESYQISGYSAPGNKDGIVKITNFSNFTVKGVVANVGLKSEITVTAKPRIGAPGESKPAGSSVSWTGRVIGAPSIQSVSSSVFGESTTWKAFVTGTKVNKNYSTENGKIAYVIWSATEPVCSWSYTSKKLLVSAPTGSFKQEREVTTDSQVSNQKSPAIEGLEDFKGYNAKVCYSNGYGKVEKKAAAKFATLVDPADDKFTYKVVQSSTALNTWNVALDKSSVPAGVVAEFNGGNIALEADWKSSIYSSVYGEAPKIYVRYCVPAAGSVAKSCSAGKRVVKPTSANQSWQAKITSAYLTDADGVKTTACRANSSLFFGLEGQGIRSGTAMLWVGNYREQVDRVAEYFEGGVWKEFTTSRGANYKLPSGASATKIRLYIGAQSSPASPVSGLKGLAPIEFNVSCTP